MTKVHTGIDIKDPKVYFTYDEQLHDICFAAHIFFAMVDRATYEYVTFEHDEMTIQYLDLALQGWLDD